MSLKTRINTTIRIVDIPIFYYTIFPIFWNLWALFRFPANIFGYRTPIILMLLFALPALFDKRVWRSLEVILWLLFSMSIFISFPNALKTELTYDAITIISGVLFAYYYSYKLKNPKLITKALIRIGLICAAFLLLDSLTGIVSQICINLYNDAARTTKLSSVRRSGLFSNSVQAACHINTALVLLFFSKEGKGKQYSFVRVSKILLLAVALLLCNKRSLIIADVIAFLIIRIVFKFETGITIKRLVNIKGLIWGILVAAAVFLLYRYVPYVNSAVQNIWEKFLSEDSYTSGSGRVLLYSLAMELFRAHPIAGIGWGRYRAYTQGIFTSASLATFDVHNVYLQLLCESGILSGVLFALCLLVPLIQTVRLHMAAAKQGYDRGFMAMLNISIAVQIVFIFYCFLGNPLYDYYFLITYFLGILLKNHCSKEMRAAR